MNQKLQEFEQEVVRRLELLSLEEMANDVVRQKFLSDCSSSNRIGNVHAYQIIWDARNNPSDHWDRGLFQIDFWIDCDKSLDRYHMKVLRDNNGIHVSWPSGYGKLV